MTRSIVCGPLLGVLCVVGTVHANNSGPEWTEIGDAGDLPDSAQKPLGVPAMLTAINGELEGLGPNFSGPGDFQDVYEIEILTPSFTIEAVPLLDGDPSFDLSLWLFDASGLGVAGNLDKDASGLANLAFPTDGMGVPIPPGTYFLAVSGDGSEPFSLAPPDLIFEFDSGDPFEISGPDGPGAGLPVTGWEAPAGLIGSYRLEMTGVGFADVPAPGSAVGFLALAFTRRRRSR